jgi:tetratricopeptide (TPR) repeat protein
MRFGRSISIITLLIAPLALVTLRRTSNLAAQIAKTDVIVEGRITDLGSKPIEDVSVRLERDGKIAQETKTGADGQYTLKTNAPGAYRLRVEKDGYSSQSMEVMLETGKKTAYFLMAKLAARDGIEFSDSPNFTIAGVTDWSNVGLHGSDANVKTSEALSKETAALKPAGGTNTSGAGDAHRHSGDEKEKAGDPVGAVKEYEAAAKLDGSEENYFAWGTELLLHRAGLPAVEVLRRAAELHPNSSRIFAALGAAYYANGQYAEATEQICRASDLNPADSQPYLFLGKMEQAASGISACSEEKLARFATEQPNNAQANFYYGLLLLKKARKTQSDNNFELAGRAFQKAAEINPKYGEVYVELGMLYNARGKRELALAEFQKAVAASPELSAGHYQLSLAYRRAGDATRADEEMKTYNRLRQSEEAALEKERREMRQFVTVLKQGSSN